MKKKTKLLLIVALICHWACTPKPDPEIIKTIAEPSKTNTHMDSVARELFVRAKYYESSCLYKQIYEEAVKSNDLPRQANACEYLGNIATRRGEFEDALSFFFKSHSIYQTVHDTVSIAWINNYIGYVYVSRNQIAKGMYYYQNAHDIACMVADSTKVQKLYGILYMNISGVYLKQENYPVFFKKAFASLRCLEDANDLNNFAINYNNLGLAYQKIGEIDKAKYWLQKGLNIYKKLGDKKQLSMIYANLGLIYADQNAYDKAENYLLRAMDLATQMDSKSSRKARHLDLAHLYEKKGNLGLALEHFTMAYAINEQMFSEESAQKTAEMETKYGMEMRQKEIKISKLELSKKEKEQKVLVIFLVIAIVGIVIIGIFIMLLLSSTKKFRAVKDDIMGSLRYARHIQSSLLPNEKHLQCILPEHFILFMPKTFVSGDFYWVRKRDEYIFFAVGDCTGHGVPAALLTMLGFTMLDECFKKAEEFQPNLVVDYINQKIATTFSTQQDHKREGMDLIVCKLHTQTLRLEYAGAKLPLYIVNNKDVTDLPTDRFNLGQQEHHTCNKSEVELSKDDVIYLASDGYTTQLGGPKDKKYSRKKFKELLLSVHEYPMDEQKKVLKQNLKKWNKDSDLQTDDILVMGICV